MSTDSQPKTEARPDAKNTHQLAAELGVDAQLLARFVREHPNPTAPIVIGWAHGRGELRCHPEQLRPDVEDWLDDRPDRAEFETDLEEALRADSLRAIRGGSE
jgi:transcriptional regulator with XRE-family HTH domain